MSSGLTEEEMRRALGLDKFSPSTPSSLKTSIAPSPVTEPDRRPQPKAKARTPKLRVTLRVSKVFDGETELFHYEADTLSRFDAEQQAVAQAKRDKFRFFELVDIKAID